MNHLHRKVVLTGVVCLALVGAAYAAAGIGLAAIVAVGLFAALAFVYAGLAIFEEESRLPWWQKTEHPEDDHHGYHPTA